MSKHHKIEDLQRSESGQFVLVALVPGQEPTIMSTEPTAFRAGLNIARNLAKELKQSGAKARLSYLPEVFIYDVEPADETVAYKLVLAPCEYFGIAPMPKPEKPEKPAKPAKEPKVKVEKPEGEKKTRKSKKVDTAATSSGSETLPALSENPQAEG